MVKKTTEHRDKKRLVILDSHAILHRAYHAIPNLSSSDGQPTGALYGLISTILRIVNDLRPDYLIATRDLPGPTHRHEKFEKYKGTRMKTDDALIVQLKRAPEIFEALGIPMYAAPGFEADDCIGTIAHDLKVYEDIDTVIASGDMDTLQLVSPSVVVYTMRKGLTDIVLYDEAAVRERYGFGPDRMIDYKALRGDPSDNIPGIKGIGEKTATELIGIFGSLEDIYTALEKNPDSLIKKGIKPRIVQLLTEGKDKAFFSKDLATIRLDAPILFVLPEAHWTLADHMDGVEKICDTFEFKSLRARVQSAVRTQSSGEKNEENQRVVEENVDPQQLKEAAVAVWVLNSDLTNPSLQTVLDYANEHDFQKAREKIFAQVHKTPSLQKVYEDIERPLIPIVSRMHEVGVMVDVKYLKSLAKEYTTGLVAIEKRIYDHAGHEFNINSPKQLGVIIYDELKIIPEKQKKTAGGARTTREDELQKLTDAHPIISDVLAYRELQKLLSTYIEKIPGLVAKDGRLHAEFLQAGSATGRMASQNPNVQNIPVKTEHGKRIRSAFVAAPGYVFAAIDYSQIELRIAAGPSGDQNLIQIFKGGGDIHTAVAAQVFRVEPEKVDREMRRRAKVINFGILYGMGVNALRANLGTGVTRIEAAEYLENYFKTFSGLATWIEETKALATKNGYTETLYGRRRHFPGLKSTMPGLRAQAERMAVNAPIQGTQADIIKLAMIEADKMIAREGLYDHVRLLLQVHDELIYEVAEKDADVFVPRLRQVMESVVTGDMLAGVPILAEASVGKSWGEMQKV